MTTDGDLLLEEFHEAGIWLPGELLEEHRLEEQQRAVALYPLGPLGWSSLHDEPVSRPEMEPIWSRIQQCAVNAKAIQTNLNRYKKAMDVRPGPCGAPWNRHPPSRQCSCSWSASWQGLREALARQFHCRPEFCYWALWVLIIGALLVWPW